MSFLPDAGLCSPARTCTLLKGVARTVFLRRGPARVAKLVGPAIGHDLDKRKWALHELEKPEYHVEWIAPHAPALAPRWGCCPHTARVMRRLDLAALTPLASVLFARFGRVCCGIQDQTEAEAMADLVMTLRPLWPHWLGPAMREFRRGHDSPVMACLTADL